MGRYLKRHGAETKFACRSDLFRFHDNIPSDIQHEKLKKAIHDLAMSLSADENLDFFALKAAARKIPRMSAERTSWARSLGLEAALARHVPPGTLDDGLEGLKNMREDDLLKMLDAFCADARLMVLNAAKAVRANVSSTSAVEANSKFEGFTGSFASLDDFHMGAEERLQLGYPNPDVLKGIYNENVEHPSATRLFLTPNYNLATCLMLEYWWAMDPDSIEALGFLEKIHKERGNVDQRHLFPGEVGDRHVECMAMISISPGGVLATESEATARFSEKMLAMQLKNKVLISAEEQARGIKVLSKTSCLNWQVKRANVFAEKYSTTGSKAQYADEKIEASSMLLGVLLPMSKTDLLVRLDRLKSVLAAIASLDGASAMLVTRLSERTEIYCEVASISEQRKQLGELSNEDLVKRAIQDWNVTCADKLDRDAILDACADAFVCRELRQDFEAAMRSAIEDAGDITLQKIMSAWDVRVESSSPEAMLKITVEALNSVKRFEEVAEWVRLFRRRLPGRTRIGLNQLMKKEAIRIKRYSLQRGDVLGIYLYTGPGFVPMNAICRSHPPEMLTILQGDKDGERNTLCTTLFCVTSGLKKLAKFTEVPEKGKVYRGLGQMHLPRDFWVQHGDPKWRGGVERAFMSTTRDKDVAMFYAGGRGTVVEISVGRIQNGGDVSWVSMVTFAPLGHFIQ